MPDGLLSSFEPAGYAQVSPQITSSPSHVARPVLDQLSGPLKVRVFARERAHAKTRKNYTPKQANILTEWARANSDHPYPSTIVIERLAEETNLTSRQIRTFFTNFRMRKWRADGRQPPTNTTEVVAE
jgi:hypothetical protein